MQKGIITMAESDNYIDILVMLLDVKLFSLSVPLVQYLVRLIFCSAKTCFTHYL